MKIVGIVQARMGSTRLPGKVLQPILGRPMIYWVIERLQQCRFIEQIVIATTTEIQDDILVSICQQYGWDFYRGSQNDVLDRYYEAARAFEATTIIRITSDCPLIDPIVTDYVIASHLSVVPQVDYTSNVLTRTYPRGLDTEAFSFASLKRAWEEDTSMVWREHVTPYIHQQPNEFRLHQVTNPTDFSQYRLTVDTPQDMDLICRIYNHFGHGKFGWGEVISVLEAQPELASLNHDIRQKVI